MDDPTHFFCDFAQWAPGELNKMMIFQIVD
jgi:hypothetical protein